MRIIRLLICMSLFISVAISQVHKKTDAELEKEKALANPYSNDFGPDSIDISSYTKEYQEKYKIFKNSCAKCHSVARPINSEFLELSDEEINSLKKSDPDMFEKNLIWKIDKPGEKSRIWNRYVKRMMNKPGCDIKPKDGKAIWEFLVYDSKIRKIGKNKEKWWKHRNSLLEEFKNKYPKRYKELYEEK